LEFPKRRQLFISADNEVISVYDATGDMIKRASTRAISMISQPDEI
jgi:hypothetical protein